MAATQTLTATFDVGSLSIVPAGSNGCSAPAGTLHLVDGWEPLCGGERVRFVFPGRLVDTAVACSKCAAKAMPVPRQRTSATARTRAKAG